MASTFSYVRVSFTLSINLLIPSGISLAFINSATLLPIATIEIEEESLMLTKLAEILL